MSLVLVITMAILVLVEAGYQYNAPSAFVLPGKNKAIFQTGHALQHIAPMNSGSINSGYSRPSSWGARPAAGSYLNTGYVQIPSAPTASHMNPFMTTIINNLDNRHFKSSMVPASANFNYGYAQNVAPSGIVGFSHGNANTAITAASSNPSKSSQTSSSGNFNNGYAQDVRQSSTGSLGLDFSVYLQPSIQTAADNLNIGHSQALATSTVSLNNDYAQKLIPLMAGNLNSGYAQTLAPSSTSSLSDTQAQNWIPSPSTGNPNHDYIQSLASGTASLNNGNAQKWIPSVTSYLNTDYSHTLVPPGTDTLSNGLTEWTSSAAGNLNTGQSQSLSSGSSSQGYSQSLNPSETGNLNTVYSQSSISSGSANVISGYSQVSSPHASSSHAEGFTSAANSNPNAVQNLNPQSSSVSSGATASIVQTTGSNTVANRYSSPIGLSNKAPVDVPSTIYKHVYFHLPPPEDEQNVVRPAPQQKKNYKILFIKVPSQERNLQQIAQIRNNAATAVEHKTLIYVLVKKPEAEQPVAISKQTPSKHEVFFVKYNVNQLDQASQGTGELNKSGSLQSIAPLEPGVNGQKINENVLK